VRAPLFRERPGLRPARRGPLAGRRVLVVVAPTECDVRAVRRLARALGRLGVAAAAAAECHGEVQAERGRPLIPNALLVEIAPDTWDALVFAGGRGAARVAEDPLARELARRFAASGRPVAALSAGARVLAAAHVDGPSSDDPRALAAALASRLRPPRTVF